MTTLLNIAIPESLVNKLGWFLIFVASFNIFGNLIGMGFYSCKDIYKSHKENKMKKKIKIRFE